MINNNNNNINSIIFVCLGNICRSPLAEAIAKEEVKKKNLDIKIASAGTSSWHIGEAPCINSQKIALKYNLDISNYKGSQISQSQLKEFDLIIALDESNYKDLLRLGADKNKLKKLGCYNNDCLDVPDPYYFSGKDEMQGFDNVFNMIKKSVIKLLEVSYEST